MHLKTVFWELSQLPKVQTQLRAFFFCHSSVSLILRFWTNMPLPLTFCLSGRGKEFRRAGMKCTAVCCAELRGLCYSSMKRWRLPGLSHQGGRIVCESGQTYRAIRLQIRIPLKRLAWLGVSFLIVQSSIVFLLSFISTPVSEVCQWQFQGLKWFLLLKMSTINLKKLNRLGLHDLTKTGCCWISTPKHFTCT